ncbi:hypothetical protein HGB47_20595 [Leptospira yasudae]|uniref:hypothetical protein n=1 Tax=Leptospira yasudae TaxID=2202201 RepID=UPI001C4FAFB6|nr:hypothetical protein [Leptospira yasudae]MBW0436009.1 hypothetical protein [Leptospira yasudae]
MKINKTIYETIPTILNIITTLGLIITILISFNQYDLSVNEKRKEVIHEAVISLLENTRNKKFSFSRNVFILKEVERQLPDEEKEFIAEQLVNLFKHDYDFQKESHIKFFLYSIISFPYFRNYISNTDNVSIGLLLKLFNQIDFNLNNRKYKDLKIVGKDTIADKRDLKLLPFNLKSPEQYFPRTEHLNSLIDSACVMFQLIGDSDEQIFFAEQLQFRLNRFTLGKIISIEKSKISRCGRLINKENYNSIWK